MCIIVYKPKGLCLKKSIYETCFENNLDGAGFLIHKKEGGLILKKGYFSFGEFWKEFQEYQSLKAIIHFRIRTHGELTEENCQPLWVIPDELAFAHNGVIFPHTKGTENSSDTYLFNEKILKPIISKYGIPILNEESFQRLVLQYIGASKLVFMSRSGEVWIFNKDQGIVGENKEWYSNESYKMKKRIFPEWKKKSKKKGVGLIPYPLEEENYDALFPRWNKPVAIQNKGLQENDIVEYQNCWFPAERGEYARIISVNQDLSANMVLLRPGPGLYVSKVPFFVLEKIEQELIPLPPNFC